MSAPAIVLIVVAGAVAIINWWSRAARSRSVELVSKPLVMVLLIGLALAITPADSAVRAWFVMALVLSLAGDVFLMLEPERFVAGLASFLGAHVAYVVGLVAAGIDVAWAIAGAGMALVAISTIGVRIVVGAVHTDPRLRQPVTAYVAIISTMLAAALGTRNGWAFGGAALFYTSDAILGWNRFVSALPHGPLLTMVTYHLGQALLVLSLLNL